MLHTNGHAYTRTHIPHTHAAHKFTRIHSPHPYSGYRLVRVARRRRPRHGALLAHTAHEISICPTHCDPCAGSTSPRTKTHRHTHTRVATPNALPRDVLMLRLCVMRICMCMCVSLTSHLGRRLHRQLQGSDRLHQQLQGV